MSKLPLTAGGAIDAVDNATVAVIRGGLPFDSSGKLVVTTSNAEADRQNGYSLDSARRIRVATSGTVARIQHGLAFDSQGRLIVTDVDPGQGVMRVGRRYSSAGSMFMAGLAFTPTALSGLAAWYKAETLDGAPAQDLWTDSSGNGRTLSSPGTGKSPTRIANALNGYSVIRFDGVDDLLTVGSGPAQPYTMFMAHVLRDDANVAVLWDSNVEASASTIYYSSLGASYILNAGGDQDTGVVPTQNQPEVVVGEFNGAASRFYRNGQSFGPFSPGANGLASGFRLGANRVAAGTQYTKYDIAEVVLYDRVLSTAERQQVEGYLLDKYALRPPTGMAAWYDASSLALADGAAVTSLGDRSGNGLTLTQATTAAQPVYGATLVNGKPGMTFDGVDDRLFTSTTFASSGAHTSFWVWTPTATAGNGMVFARGSGHAEGGFNSSGNRTSYRAGAVNTILTDTSLNVPIICSGRAGSDGTMSIREQSNTNGLRQNSATGVTVNNNTATIIQLGSRGTSLYAAGHIAEVITYNRALTDAERQQAERYLGAKYGITVA